MFGSMYRAAKGKSYPKLESLLQEPDQDKVEEMMVMGMQARLKAQEQAIAEGRMPKKRKRVRYPKKPPPKE